MAFKDYIDGVFPPEYRGTAFISDVRLVLTKLEKDGYLGQSGGPVVPGELSQLELVSAGLNTGWRILSDPASEVGQSPANKLSLGNASIDLSFTFGTRGEVSGVSSNYGFASGVNNVVTGAYAASFGVGNTSAGEASFTCGSNNSAGNFSVVAGSGNQAGIFAIAAGNSTQATGIYSVAFGSSTIASGAQATAIGLGTTSSAKASVAFGYNTTAGADYSMVLGQYSTTYGTGSLAGGNYSSGAGANSIAFGNNCTSGGISSQAVGNSNNSTGDYSHAEGNTTEAGGTASHAEGIGTIAQNPAMHAEGKFNIGTSIDTIHETGIGIDSLNRKNAFEIYTDGTLTAPESTIALINSRGVKAIPTKEYVDASFTPAVDPGDSTATTVAGLVSDYNILLANLRTQGIIA